MKAEILHPAGAYLAMAVEAAGQKAFISGLQVQSYLLRDVTFSKDMRAPDTSDGVEVSLTLESFWQSSAAVSSSWNEFRVLTFGPDRKAYKNCQGLISVSHDPSFDFSPEDEATMSMMRYDEAMKPDLYKHWMAQAATSGNELGPSFQLVSECCLKGEHIF